MHRILSAGEGFGKYIQEICTRNRFTRTTSGKYMHLLTSIRNKQRYLWQAALAEIPRNRYINIHVVTTCIYLPIYQLCACVIVLVINKHKKIRSERQSERETETEKDNLIKKKLFLLYSSKLWQCFCKYVSNYILLVYVTFLVINVHSYKYT